jgi:hypothetical protein
MPTKRPPMEPGTFDNDINSIVVRLYLSDKLLFIINICRTALMLQGWIKICCCTFVGEALFFENNAANGRAQYIAQ